MKTRFRSNHEGGLAPILACTATICLAAPCAIAEIIWVPDDYPSIQDAIDASLLNGDEFDEIIIRDGAWTGERNKNLDFYGQPIWLHSENGASSCIIDCEGAGRGVFLKSGESRDARIEGLTITNARSGDGSGIRLEGASVTISGCQIVNNHVSAGITRYGGGIGILAGSDALIVNCLIAGNSALGGTSNFGGGIAIVSSDPLIINCTLSENSSVVGGAVANTGDSQSEIVNTIIWGNVGGSIGNLQSGSSNVCYSDVEGGIAGISNLNADPLFVSPSSGDFALAAESPCVDSGTNSIDLTSFPFDVIGEVRIADGDRDLQSVVDMGAYEFQPQIFISAIDVKPGSYPNSINLGSNGVVPVAILSSLEFDATQADPTTVTLAGAGIAVRGKGNKYLAHIEDVNFDTLDDLVLQVETENLDPNAFQDGYAWLTGFTFDGLEFEGSDEITIVPD